LPMTLTRSAAMPSCISSAAMYWLVAAYFLHTIGELCASPVALSFITKLAPQRYVAFMMGAYFAATGLGNKLAGALGELSTEAGELAVFAGIFGFCLAFGILMLLALRPPQRELAHSEGSGSGIAFDAGRSASEEY
ncbi:MAG: MFS transporter, partial [Pseudomonadota bacterium]